MQWADGLWALKLHPTRGDDPRRQALWEERGQARREWAPVLQGQGEAAGSLGTRKQASPGMAPAGDLGTPQPPGLQQTTFCCLSASLPKKTKTGLFMELS